MPEFHHLTHLPETAIPTSRSSKFSRMMMSTRVQGACHGKDHRDSLRDFMRWSFHTDVCFTDDHPLKYTWHSNQKWVVPRWWAESINEDLGGFFSDLFYFLVHPAAPVFFHKLRTTSVGFLLKRSKTNHFQSFLYQYLQFLDTPM